MMKDVQSIERYLIRFVVLGYFSAGMFTMWDVWGHILEIRETFWVPQHISLEIGYTISCVSSLWGWYITRSRTWRNIAIGSVALVFGMIWDAVWHIVFRLDTATPADYSPPHFFMAIAVCIASVYALKILAAEKDPTAKFFFLSLTYVLILTALGAPITQFHPLSNLHFLGFYGAIFSAFLLTLVLLSATRWVQGAMTATLVIVLAIYMGSIGTTVEYALIMTRWYELPNGWMNSFSLMLAGLFMDVTKTRVHDFIRAVGASTLYSGFLYSYASKHLVITMQYSRIDALIAIFMSVVGGILAYFFYCWMQRQRIVTL